MRKREEVFGTYFLRARVVGANNRWLGVMDSPCGMRLSNRGKCRGAQRPPWDWGLAVLDYTERVEKISHCVCCNVGVIGGRSVDSSSQQVPHLATMCPVLRRKVHGAGSSRPSITI